MQRRKATQGVVWYLGAIQYCILLFGGGALWFLAVQLTGFFWDDHVTQVAACVVLAALIMAESLWAYMPGLGNVVREFSIDVLTSAAIVGFGMVVVAFILSWLRA